ncbi:MAG: hypothetical protein SFU91_10645 [Chloroherpetonaceae bacterium]|nr:hypothetical protein [Chloroherpetonaceae bacterium]
MKLSGFTFIRNGIKFSYPFQETLRTLLNLCDEVVIAVGKSEDGTLDAVKKLSTPKLKIIETVWDSTLKGGKTLAAQTDIALSHCTGDWCLYLQGDENIHENDYVLLLRDIARSDEQQSVEGVLLNYLHFYGNYTTLATGRKWYRHEIRVVRNNRNIVSWGDAQGFRKKINSQRFEKIKCLQSQAKIYHYGWVRPPQEQDLKLYAFNRLYEETPTHEWTFGNSPLFDISTFTGTHPMVMQEKIAHDARWAQLFSAKLTPKPLLHKVSDWIESLTGHRIGEYKNYQLKE